jgi:hypothetical protein
MPRVLIVCDGDGPPVIAYSPTFRNGPAFEQALRLTRWPSGGVRLEPAPQSQIDRFDLPDEADRGGS